MDKNKFKNSLTDRPIIEKPKLGFGAKRIFDAQGFIVGSVSGNKIFDLNGRLWGRIVTKNEAAGFNKNEIVDRGSVIATIDSHNNIYRRVVARSSYDATPSNYIGTVKSNKMTSVFLPLLIIALIVTIATSAVLAMILKNKSEPDYLKYAPVIDVYSQQTGSSWTQESSLKIFSSSQYNTKSFIAPGDTGFYPFVVKNKDLYPIDYTITFGESNAHRFPLKYRLWYRTYYVGGSSQWRTLEDLTKHTQELEAGQTDAYRLEWWWDPNVSDVIDTNLGNHRYTYRIDISISATFVTRAQ